MTAMTDLGSSGPVESLTVTPVAGSAGEDNTSLIATTPPIAAIAVTPPALAASVLPATTSVEAHGAVADIAPIVLVEPPTVAEWPVAREAEARIAVSAATETPVAADAQPVVEAPASVEAAAVVDQHPPLEAVQTVNPVTISTPSTTLQQSFEESGLIMVETSRDKAQPLPQEFGNKPGGARPTPQAGPGGDSGRATGDGRNTEVDWRL
jgi:hypothetical protein